MEQNLELWPHAVVVMYLLNLQKDGQVCYLPTKPQQKQEPFTI